MPEVDPERAAAYGRQAAVYLRLASKYDWAPDQLNLIPGHLYPALYDELFPDVDPPAGTREARNPQPTPTTGSGAVTYTGPAEVRVYLDGRELRSGLVQQAQEHKARTGSTGLI